MKNQKLAQIRNISTVNVVNVSYLISFTEGNARVQRATKLSFPSWLGYQLREKIRLFLNERADPQSFSISVLSRQCHCDYKNLYRLAGTIIGACKKKKERKKRKRKERNCKNETKEECMQRMHELHTVVITALGNYIHPRTYHTRGQKWLILFIPFIWRCVETCCALLYCTYVYLC